MIKIKGVDKIKKIFEHPIYLFIFLLLVDLIIGGFLFWQVILSPESDTAKPQSLLILNKANLDKFVQSITVQEKDFQNNDLEKSLDIFIGFPTTTISTNSTSTQAQ